MLIDITRLALRRARGVLPTGVDRVGLAHIEHHRRQARAVLLHGRFDAVLQPADSAAAFQWLLAPPPPHGEGWRGWARLARWCWRAERQPAVAGQVLLHTAHQGLEAPRHAGRLRRGGARQVFVVHDLIPVTHPEYARVGEDERHRRRLHHVLTRASGIVVNSDDTLHALRRHAQALGLPLPPTVVGRLAPGVRGTADAPRPRAPPYVVVLGTIEPRKNHRLLLTVWRELHQRQREQAPHLVVIGRRGWEVDETMNLMQRCPALRGHVHHRPHCTDGELAAWLRHAQAVLFPSFCEGFGLPVVEALAAGVPVIASDLPVLRESAGDVPEYVSPLDGPRWLELVTAYARPAGPQRLAQLRRLAGHTVPTWDDHHRPVDGLLQALQG